MGFQRCCTGGGPYLWTPRKALSVDAIKALAIRCPNWIGDAVMATPAIELVRRTFKDASITAVCNETIAKLLAGTPAIDTFVIVPSKKTSKEQRACITALRQHHFDLGILLTRSFSSAWLFWRARIPIRLGYDDHWRTLFLTHPMRVPTQERHDVQSYLDLLKPFAVAEPQPTLRLYVTEGDLAAARARVPKTKKVVVVNPGAAYGSAKCWPKEHFRGLVQLLLRHQEIACLFVGDEKCVPLVNGILSGLTGVSEGRAYSLAGRTSLKELMALIRLSDCVVTNDSGPMHIAAAFGRPLVALFGSTNPHRTGPWGKAEVIYKSVECSPCYLRECPSDFRCMWSISPEEVYKKVLLQLTSGA